MVEFEVRGQIHPSHNIIGNGSLRQDHHGMDMVPEALFIVWLHVFATPAAGLLCPFLAERHTNYCKQKYVGLASDL